MDKQVLDLINKECMQQYEKVRQLGTCNMFDMNCVCDVAYRLKMWELSTVSANRKDYITLLENFGKLMKHYEIEQDNQHRN